MQKLLKYIILFGIFMLPLINSRITSLLGFSFSMPVSGNFEFTKVVFFNIWSSVVISLFFVSFFLLDKRKYPKWDGVIKWLIPFYTILLISTIFSESPIVSFLGNNEKSHSFLMWSNLVGLYIVFSTLLSPPLAPLGRGELFENKEKNIFFKQIINTFIFSGVLVSIIGLKEYFFPTFNYGDLANRLFSTFGHPNYLSIFLVGLMPFLYEKLFPFFKGSTHRGRDYILLFLLFIITLILTKSFIAIFLFLVFNIYYFLNLSSFSIKGSTIFGSMKKIGMDYKKFSLIIFFIILFLFTLIYFFLPEKLHSFISRYFIWETTIRIIFSDIKLFLIGGGADTLTLFFNNFKSEYVYIFENLGYTADRPHNIILNFFYHFGIGGLIFISFLYYKVLKNFINSPLLTREGARGWALILIFIFLLFNPTNIVIYLFITILLADLFISEKTDTFLLDKIKSSTGDGVIKIFLFYITITSIIGAYFSYHHYISETYSYKNDFTKALNYYKFNPELYFIKGDFDNGSKISKIKNQDYFKYKIRNRLSTEGFNPLILNIINEFLNKYNYAENYFYIGNMFWDMGGKELAKKYYEKGLGKLPDLWNKDSKYYDKFIVKKLKIDDHRLTSEKYGLAKILYRVKVKKN